MADPQDSPRPATDYVARSQFADFHGRDKRWAVIVAHRRCGKTVACVMELLTRALATWKKDARYAYIAPFREQAKIVAWSYLKHYAQNVVKDQAKDFRESELAVRLYNGSEVRLYGADNPNALRGIYLDGVVMDEYADMRPSLWGEVIRPALSDRQGWAVFIGTPRGRNAFYEIYRDAQADSEWYQLTLPASKTGLLSSEELASAAKSMTGAQYAQEYECSFEAAIHGAVYAKELSAARSGARITAVPYDGARLVNAAFDIGRRDATAVWFYQLVHGEVRILEYFEDHLETVGYYAEQLKKRAYKYDTLYLPHDAENETIVADVTFADVMTRNGFKVQIVPKFKVEDGINAARMLFPRCLFDAKKTEAGLECLANYHWGYNARMDEMKFEPVHDWSSHGADAFRYLAVSVRMTDKPFIKKPIKYPKLGYA